MQKDPLKYCALKRSVVDDMAERRGLICELFQRCGRAELRFIVDVGLWGGALLGLAQMALWLVRPACRSPAPLSRMCRYIVPVRSL